MTGYETTRDSLASERGRGGRMFATLLFAVITLFLLVALLVGMNAYRSANAMRTEADDMRLGLSLLSNSVRTNDVTDAVGVAEGPEGPALVLTEHLEAGTYETRLYWYEGYVMEEYTRAGSAFTPERAREVVESSRFDFEYRNGLLTIYTDQGSACVALRSVRGGA
ncbi:DUF4860 domain-containing protein [Adlercreutzia sp. ZJ473]|uniref:DUF4860 domain-containing protein n=1 Tax=Adlercreutzia sp. ZJ473 TaxID=2722822 RepID=UPI001551BB11|nr:DUF4860 domain-containing protein [Adlercreutzia sp. ZJ473]